MVVDWLNGLGMFCSRSAFPFNNDGPPWLLLLLVESVQITPSNVTTIGKSSAEVLTVDYSGYYGNGLALYPSYTGMAFIGKSNHAFLNVYSCNFLTPSDFRLKENIHNLSDGLSIVKQLNAVKYDYKLSDFGDSAKIGTIFE